MTLHITGELFKKMIFNAAAAIENNKQEINDLNVFPVPDGDTGTNMSLTISAAETALAGISPATLQQAADITASALLRGARGNSGVILSLLFRGFSRSLKDVAEADAPTYANALTAGVESAYKAVMKPAEGTILTVSRLAADAAVLAATSETDIEKVIEAALKAGYAALDDTINQNPVLQKAGVIDAGGKGYLYILDGMLKAIHGQMLEKASSADADTGRADFTQYTSEDITFAYCTEFIVERSGGKNADYLRNFLDTRGDSIVVVDDDEIIKVHVHTNEPGIILTEALTYGALLSVKIENMREQHTEVVANAEMLQSASPSRNAPPVPPEMAPDPPRETKEYGFVAVCAGAGMEALFRDLGVDGIIMGGQTMNPSTEDILEKINEAPAKTVFVLPNNKNIILAAEQCTALSDKRVIVIPTKSVPQGVTAMLAIDGISDADEMKDVMTTSIKQMHTAQVTTAARTSVFDGTKIKKGSHLALIDDTLAASGFDFESVISCLADTLGKYSPEYITIYVGEGVRGDEAENVANIFRSALPDAEVVHISGGQPIYSYIISAE